MEAIDYLRMSLEMTPTEYLETSRETYETALAYQNARTRGIEKARADHQQHKENERKKKQALENVKAMIG